MAALAIVTGGIHQAQAVLVSFRVTVFPAVIGAPSVLWLEQKGIACSRGVAGMAAILAVIRALVGPFLNSFYADLEVNNT